MDKKDLARRLARASHRSNAQAADELDALLHSMLKDLKHPAKESDAGVHPARSFNSASARINDVPRRGE